MDWWGLFHGTDKEHAVLNRRKGEEVEGRMTSKGFLFCFFLVGKGIRHSRCVLFSLADK